MLSKVTGSRWPGKARPKACTYPGMERSVASTRSGVLFISTLAWTGPLACSLRSAARPSQNWAALSTALSTVGELRGPFCQPWPMETGTLSAPPVPTLWQVLQLITWLRDRRGSKNSHWPSSICSAVIGWPRISLKLAGIGANNALASSRNSPLWRAGDWAVAGSAAEAASAIAQARADVRSFMSDLAWGWEPDLIVCPLVLQDVDHNQTAHARGRRFRWSAATARPALACRRVRAAT